MGSRLVWFQYRKLLQATLIGAVFLCAAPRGISEHFRALLAAGRELEEGVPVLRDLKGEECVGVAFCDGTDASIRYVMNCGDHAKDFRSRRWTAISTSVRPAVRLCRCSHSRIHSPSHSFSRGTSRFLV